MTSGLVGFQYFVVRCVPRVDREEFVNVGVVLYSQAADFLGATCILDDARVRALDPDADLQAVRAALRAIEAVCRGDESAGPQAHAPLRVRFGWLAAPRSTVLQPGPVHGGVSADPAAELQQLTARLVSRP